MSLHQFEELEIWKRSARLAVSILELIDGIKLYALKDQMARCCISVPSNIAEGAERESDKEFRRFLAIAKGSAGELRTQLYIGIKAGVFPSDKASPLIDEAKQISSMIEGLRKRLGGGSIISIFLPFFF
jgi:four helix bundle protein